MERRISLKAYENYQNELTTMGMDRYCGHHKIIRYADGLPVYTLSLPPMLSSAYAYSQVNASYRVIQNRPLPNLASVALTDVCNANCEHCSFFSSLDDNKKQVLSVEEFSDLFRQTQELGASVINIVGGEPLMSPNWREIFKSIDKRKSHLVMFTNGWFLAESAADLKAVGVGGVYVSLDASQAALHDKKRGLPGLYAKAMEGITAAIKADLSVGISCCVDEHAFESGELDNIIELGKRKGVHEILVFDAMPVGRFSKRGDLTGQKSWLDLMNEKAKRYNEDETYPGVLIYAHMTSYRANGCTAGTGYFYSSPYGEICPCDFHHLKFGNIREEKLYTIWDRMIKQFGCHGSNWNGCWTKQKQIT